MTQVQLQHNDVEGYTFAGNVDWVALLREDCTKAFQACIHLQREGLGGFIILEFGCIY